MNLMRDWPWMLGTLLIFNLIISTDRPITLYNWAWFPFGVVRGVGNLFSTIVLGLARIIVGIIFIACVYILSYRLLGVLDIDLPQRWAVASRALMQIVPLDAKWVFATMLGAIPAMHGLEEFRMRREKHKNDLEDRADAQRKKRRAERKARDRERGFVGSNVHRPQFRLSPPSPELVERPLHQVGPPAKG